MTTAKTFKATALAVLTAASLALAPQTASADGGDVALGVLGGLFAGQLLSNGANGGLLFSNRAPQANYGYQQNSYGYDNAYEAGYRQGRREQRRRYRSRDTYATSHSTPQYYDAYGRPY